MVLLCDLNLALALKVSITLLMVWLFIPMILLSILSSCLIALYKKGKRVVFIWGVASLSVG